MWGLHDLSTFSLQTLGLLQHGAWWRAGGNMLFSVVLCLLAVWLGVRLGMWANAAD
ncbi:MAG: hypothetical protein R3202_04505 [Candidatus Competibacterales bacterium]|nr:hypothetical protein [Candidatus Competibacterales bacterium]